MKTKFDFTTEEERKTLITQQRALGLRLKEEQYYLDGKHLIFTDEPVTLVIPARNILSELDNLKAQVILIKNDIDILKTK